MKKIVAALLCLIMLLSLFSCSVDDNKTNQTTAESVTQVPENNKQPSKKYFDIEKIDLTTVKYYIYDMNGDTVFAQETSRPLEISMIGEYIVDICIGMGTGISIHQYYDAQNNRFSDEYSYVAASSLGGLVAYIDTSMENPIYNRKLVVRDIFDKNIFYKSFNLDFAPAVTMPIESARFTDGENELEIVYLSERPATPFSATLVIRANGDKSGILCEQDLAMEMYEAVLNNEVEIYDTIHNKRILLADCTTPYNGIPLSDCEQLKYAYTDMDNDAINELVIDCGDTLILRYYEGNVYLYSFTFRALYYLNTDGSYTWNHTGQDFEYGENKLYFEGVALKTKELYRIVNDGEPNVEFYIEGKQVTQEEILKYIENNSKTRVEFEPLEATWQKTISLEKALEIAAEYWYECYNIKPGDKASETGFPYGILPKNSDNANYKIALAWLVDGNHYSTIEMIEIDSITGEIILPDYDLDGKG